MAKSAGFVNPMVKKSIETVAGTAYYQQTEIEDILGRWNDNYYTEDGSYVIHEGNQHHVYKVQTKGKVSAGVRSPHIAGGKYQFQGKGWHESPDRTGKAPVHKEVATRVQAKQVQNKPMKKKETQLPQEIKEIKAHMQWVKESTILDKWNKHLDSLDRYHKGFEIFDSNSGESSVKELSKIIEGGQEALYEKVDELRDYNSEAEYEMFKQSFKEFLKDEDIEEDSIEDEDAFRMDFEGHINWNIEKLFDFNILLKDGNDPKRKAFKKEALKYISEKQFEEIMNNSYGGTGFFGIIINAQDIIKAIRDNEKTVNDNRLIVGVHEMMSGSGYFKEARAEYKVNLDRAELDEGRYSLGDIFGHVDWKWR